MQRIQFEVPEERLTELERLMDSAKIRTKKELLNNALTFFEWALDEVRKGHSIASVDEKSGKYREIMMPVFRNIAGTSPISTNGGATTAKSGRPDMVKSF